MDSATPVIFVYRGNVLEEEHEEWVKRFGLLSEVPFEDAVEDAFFVESELTWLAIRELEREASYVACINGCHLSYEASSRLKQARNGSNMLVRIIRINSNVIALLKPLVKLEAHLSDGLTELDVLNEDLRSRLMKADVVSDKEILEEYIDHSKQIRKGLNENWKFVYDRIRLIFNSMIIFENY